MMVKKGFLARIFPQRFLSRAFIYWPQVWGRNFGIGLCGVAPTEFCRRHLHARFTKNSDCFNSLLILIFSSTRILQKRLHALLELRLKFFQESLWTARDNARSWSGDGARVRTQLGKRTRSWHSRMFTVSIARRQLFNVHLFCEWLRRQQQEILAVFAPLDQKSSASEKRSMLLRARRIVLWKSSCGRWRAMRRGVVGNRRQRSVLRQKLQVAQESRRRL